MTGEFKKLAIGIIALMVLMAVIAVLLPPFWEAMRYRNCLSDVVTSTRSCTDYALSATQNSFTDDGSIASTIIGDQTYYNGSASLTVKGVKAEEIYMDLIKTDQNSTANKPLTYYDLLMNSGANSYLSTVGSMIGQPLGAVGIESVEELASNASTNCLKPFYTPTNFNVAYVNDDLLKSQLKKSLLVLAQSQTTADGDYKWVFDLDGIDVTYYDSKYETETDKLPILENYDTTSGFDKSAREKRLLSVFGAIGENDSSSPLNAFKYLSSLYASKPTLQEQFDKRWDLSWYTSTNSIWSVVPTYYVEVKVPWYYITRTTSFNIDTSKGGMNLIQNIRMSFAVAVSSDSTGFTTPTKLLTNSEDYFSLTASDQGLVNNWCDFWNTSPTQVLISGGSMVIKCKVTGLA